MPNKRHLFINPTNLICAGVMVAAFIIAAILYPGLGGLTIWSLLISLGVGGGLWLILHFIKSDYKMTVVEATIAAAVLIVAVVPLTDYVGTKLAFENQTTYHEFLNGYEAHVTSVTYQCYESSDEGGSTGGCTHTFDADSYTVQVPYQVCTSDSKGNQTCTTEYRTETRYRQVPYTQTETTWIVQTTLGDITVGSHWLEDNPSAHRIRAHDGSEDSYGGLNSGTPALWLAAQQRIASGNPGPVTVPNDYANYILASQTTILHKYSPYIKQYQAAKVLPDLKHSITDSYFLDRTYFVGTSVANPDSWNIAVQRYDAALGTGLQGDMYVVIVNSNTVTNPDLYIQTLTAYWESPAFDKDDISKNAIVVAIGTKDGQTVDWARASTGMPVGNSTMIYNIQNDLPGKALTPATILGSPTASIKQVNGKYKATIVHNQPQGALESIMWGENGFQRVCMSCTSSGDKNKSGGVGFDYLKSQIKPTGGQTFAILGVLFLLSILVWCLAVFLAVPISRNIRGGGSTLPYPLGKSRGGGWS